MANLRGVKLSWLLAGCVSVATSSALAQAPGYMGCFKDGGPRDLPHPAIAGGAVSTGICVEACKAAGYAYAGTQFSSQCFCGNTFGSYGPATNCNMACSAAPAEVCGGGWANSVWDTGTATAQVPDCPKLVGQFPNGITQAAAAQGNYVYFASGASLVVADATEVLAGRAASPAKVGAVFLAGRSVTDIALSGSRAYVVDGKALHVVDVSDPANPRIEGSWASDTVAAGCWVSRVAVLADRAYVSGCKLAIVDVSVPASPQLKGSIGPNLSGGVAVLFDAGFQRTYALATSGYTLTVVNVSDPVNPTVVATVPSKRWAAGVALSGTFAYMQDNGYGLRVFDVANPEMPVEKGAYLHGVNAQGGITVSGGRAYLVTDSALQIVDVANPDAPALLGSYSVTRNHYFTVPWDVALSGSATHAYVSYGTSLKIVDVTAPAAPREAGSYDTANHARKVVVSGNHAYLWTMLAGAAPGLRIYDLADANRPVEVASVALSRNQGSLAISGNFLYVWDVEALKVFDVSNPAAPVLLGSHGLAFGVQDLAAAGSYLYVGALPAGLKVLDVSDPPNRPPQEVASLEVGGNWTTLSGRYAYLWNSADLSVVDIAIPTAPRVVGTYRAPDVINDVGISGLFAYVATKTLGTRVLDLYDPSDPREIGRFGEGGSETYAQVVESSGHLAIVKYDRGVAVLNACNPRAPVVAGRSAATDSSTSAQSPLAGSVLGSSVYIPTLSGAGVNIFDTSACLAHGAPPSAEFLWSPTLPVPATSVQFQHRAPQTCGPFTYSWDFGDGATSTEGGPTHAFAAEGTQTVTLTVSNTHGSDTVSKTLEVVPAALAGFTVRPIPPSQPFQGVYRLRYGNEGAAPLSVVPILKVSSQQDVPMRLQGSKDAFRKGPIQILAIDLTGPPGPPPPGSLFEVPIEFQPGNLPKVDFTLEVGVPTSDPIPWATLEPGVRSSLSAPMADDAWAAMWSNFTRSTGAAWQDYWNTLLTASTYLDQHYCEAPGGTDPDNTPGCKEAPVALYDVRALVNFIMARASASLGPRQVLSTAQDVFAGAPGVALAFDRIAGARLDHRHALGPLGRGWAHLYQYTLENKGGGRLVVTTPAAGTLEFVGPRSQAGKILYDPTRAGSFASIVDTGSYFYLVDKRGQTLGFDKTTGRLVCVLAANGNRVVLAYTEGRLETVTHTNTKALTLAYNGQGRIDSVTDPEGRVARYRYDATGEYLSRVEYFERAGDTQPAGTLEYAYRPADGTPAAHALQDVTFADGTRRHFWYDPSTGDLGAEWKDTVAAPGVNELVRYEYGPQATVRVSSPPGSPVATVRYGPGDLTLAAEDAAGHLLRTGHDADLNLTWLFLPDGGTAMLQHDGRGNVTAARDAAGNVTRATYTPLTDPVSDLPKRVTDARTNWTDFGYDADGNLSRTNYGGSQSEGFTLSGNLRTHTRRRGQTIQYQADADGRLDLKTYPDGSTVDYAYLRGKLSTVTSTPMVDGVPGTPETINAYHDARGFPFVVVYPDGHWVLWEYDAGGRRTKRVDDSGLAVEYGYDGVGRLASVKTGVGGAPATELVHYWYDATGRLAWETRANGTFTGYEYEPSGRLFRVTHTGPAPAYELQSRFEYGYDSLGNPASLALTQGASPLKTTYAYDAGQLTEETIVDAANQPLRTKTYTYDGVGNRRNVTTYGYDAGGNRVSESETSYAVDNMNQYGVTTTTRWSTAMTGCYRDSGTRDLPHHAINGAVSTAICVDACRVAGYQYAGTQYSSHCFCGDTYGRYGPATNCNMACSAAPQEVCGGGWANSVWATDGSASVRVATVSSASHAWEGGHLKTVTFGADTSTYEYDDEDRLEQLSVSGGAASRYGYDALGNRASTDLNGVVRRWVWEPIGLGSVAAEYDGAGALVARYVYGLGLAARIDAAGNRAYYAFDGAGHTRQVTDAGGAVVNSYDYSPYGETRVLGEGVPNPFRYAGRFGVMDDGNGLLFMRARYYSPGLGRFIGPDPLHFGGGDVNLYRYVRNSPLLSTDPSGLMVLPLQMKPGDPDIGPGGVPWVSSRSREELVNWFKEHNEAGPIQTNYIEPWNPFHWGDTFLARMLDPLGSGLFLHVVLGSDGFLKAHYDQYWYTDFRHILDMARGGIPLWGDRPSGPRFEPPPLPRVWPTPPLP